MTLTTVTDTPEDAGAKPDAREAPILKQNCLKWQAEGFAWRDAFVRLPDNLILQDLQDVPSIWRNVQSSPQSALRKFDRVTAVAFDESWLVKDCLVTEADTMRVVLSIRPGDVIRMGSKAAEWRDEQHTIRWAGSGFGVFRNSDGVQLLQPVEFATIEAAKSELFRQFYRAKRSA